jgi:hypothetical protein
MAVRIEFHPPPRRRKGTSGDRPSAMVVIGIATAIVGTHVLFWLVGLLE